MLLFVGGGHSRTDGPYHRSRRRLFPPTLEDDDTREAITEQTFHRARRTETRVGISIY